MYKLNQINFFLLLLKKFSPVIIYQQLEKDFLNLKKIRLKKKFFVQLYPDLFYLNFVIIYNFNYRELHKNISIDLILAFAFLNFSGTYYFIRSSKFLDFFPFYRSKRKYRAIFINFFKCFTFALFNKFNTLCVAC